jgi:uncharacterized delta-60 repeat protein
MSGVWRSRRIAMAAGLTLCAVLGVAWAGTAAASTPGQIDPSFGVSGIALTSFGLGQDRATAMAIQPDGKYIVAGTHEVFGGPTGSTIDVTLVRFGVDGILDPTFGTGGKVEVYLQEMPAAFFSIDAAAIDPSSGDIYVVNSNTPGTAGGPLAVARFLPNGQLDTTFGGNGIVLPDLSPWKQGNGSGTANTVAVRQDGRVLLGTTLTTSFKNDFAVFSLSGSGAVDTSFGVDGRKIVDMAGGSDDQLDCMALMADGRLVIAGSCQGDAALVRLTPAGALDTGFGQGGKVITPSGTLGGSGRIRDITVAADASIAAIGPAQTMVRYTAAGSLDSSFGPGGTAQMWGVEETGKVTVAHVLLQADGKVLLAGTRNSGYPTYQDIWLSRLNADGTLDTGFGTNGTVVTDFGGADDCAAFGIGPDQRPVAAGYALTAATRSLGAPFGVITRAGAGGVGVARYDNDASSISGAHVQIALGRSARVAWKVWNPAVSGGIFDVRYESFTKAGVASPWVDWQTATTAPQANMTVSPGLSYAMSCRVTTTAGRTFAWSSPTHLTMPLGQSALKRGAGWRTIKASACYLGSSAVARKGNAVLSTSTGGSLAGVALVATTGKGAGRVEVDIRYKQGAITRRIVLGKVSLASKKTQHRKVIWVSAKAQTLPASYTIMIITLNKRPVAVEGLAICR